MGTLIGYTRVALESSEIQQQKEELTLAGCETIFEDIASGMTLASERAGLSAALKCLCEGDTLTVCDYARLSRSISHLPEVIQELQYRKVNIKALH